MSHPVYILITDHIFGKKVYLIVFRHEFYKKFCLHDIFEKISLQLNHLIQNSEQCPEALPP